MLPEFQEEPPFDPSLMTHFRKRIDANIINQINESIVKEEITKENSDEKDDGHDSDDDSSRGSSASKNNDTQSKKDQPMHKGKVIYDATCVRADIAYPTDLETEPVKS